MYTNFIDQWASVVTVVINAHNYSIWKEAQQKDIYG